MPFISIINLISIDIFLDSFENSQYYLCLQNNNNFPDLKEKNSAYVILQKSSHPDFDIKISDTVIYCKTNGEIACDKVEFISIDAVKTYHIKNYYDISSQSIFECQIIGKVINIIENNIWNSISIKFWETSKNSLNLKNLLIKC